MSETELVLVDLPDLPAIVEELDEADRERVARLVLYLVERANGRSQEYALGCAGFTRMTLSRWRRQRPELLQYANAILVQTCETEVLEEVLEQWPDIVRAQLRAARLAERDADKLKAAQWIRETFIAPLQAHTQQAQEEREARKPLEKAQDFTPVPILVQQNNLTINVGSNPGKPDRDFDEGEIVEGETVP